MSADRETLPGAPELNGSAPEEMSPVAELVRLAVVTTMSPAAPELPVNALGGETEGELAQGREIRFAEEILLRCGGPLGEVHLAVA